MTAKTSANTTKRRSTSTTRRSSTTRQQLTKDEIRDLLALTQKKLADAEKALEDMGAVIAEKDGALEALATKLEQATDEGLENRVDSVTTSRKLAIAEADAKRYQGEILQMTHLLVNAMNQKDGAERQAAEAQEVKLSASEQIRAAQAGLKAAETELATVKQKQNAKVRRLEENLAQKQDKIEEQVRELAASAALLQEANARIQDAENRADLYLRSYRSAIHWMSGIGAILTSAPLEEQPGNTTFAEYADFLIQRGAFDPEWYSATYQDVADGGVHPGVHFLRYGVLEGRHPTDILDFSAAEAPAEQPNESTTD